MRSVCSDDRIDLVRSIDLPDGAASAVQGRRRGVLVDVVGMSTLVAVIEAGSFTGAARKMGTSKSVISRRISDIEHQLGIVLLDRTAVRVSATEVGAAYYPECVRILESIEIANDLVAGFHGNVRGAICIVLPQILCAGIMAPILAKFAVAYPDLQVDVEIDEHEQGLQDSGFDVAVRIGNLANSSMLVRAVARSRSWICASPGYLQTHGVLSSPKMLIHHDCLLHASSDMRSGWCLQEDGNSRFFHIRERLRSACYFQLLEAAKSGLGLALLPGYFIADAVAKGELVILLPDYAPPSVPVSLIYPSSRKMSQKVRLLIRFLADQIPNLIRDVPGRLVAAPV